MRDENGYFYKEAITAEVKMDVEEVRRETAAQFKKVENDGIKIAHVDNHMGTIYGMFTGKPLPQIALDECSKRKLGFRLPKEKFCHNPDDGDMPEEMMEQFKPVFEYAKQKGVFLPDYLIFHEFYPEKDETYDSFKAMMIRRFAAIPEGLIVETYIHPAVKSKTSQEVTPTSYIKRDWEFRLMLDPEFEDAMQKNEVNLITYKEAEKLRKDGVVKA